MILKLGKNQTHADAEYKISTPGTVRVPMACPGIKNYYLRPKIKDIETVIRDALRRYQKGKDEHGELDLSTDQRDFILEAEQELLDCINYCIFQILRLRWLQKQLQK